MTTLGDGLQEMIDPERELVPSDIYEIGSMLSNEERLLLHHAGRTGVPGAIVELGAFLGGSTLALATGAAHRDARVDSFDLFRLAGDWEKNWFPPGMNVDTGESTIPIYEHNISRVRDRVTVHEGDICAATWDKPIGVLFIDIAKSWTTADAVWNTFFPWLQPGALVIQQDLVHWGHPWCAIIMEHLAEHFEYVGWTWTASSVWRCKSVPADIPESLTSALTLDELLELTDRAAERVGWPASQSIRLGGADCLLYFGEIQAARDLVDRIRPTISNEDLPFIEEAFVVHDDRIRRMAAGATYADVV